MKANKVKNQIKVLKRLLHEQALIQATIKLMEGDEEKGILDVTPEQAQYLKNLKKRLISIEEQFDNILK